MRLFVHFQDARLGITRFVRRCQSELRENKLRQALLQSGALVSAFGVLIQQQEVLRSESVLEKP
jgi:hypothetical protein